MAVFAYKAIDPSAQSRPIKGTCSAGSAMEARQSLRAKGLQIQRLTEVSSTKAAGNTSAGRRWWGRRSEAQVTGFVQELSTLLGAGIPLLDSMDAVRSQYRGQFLTDLLSLREQVSAGSSLADAMRRQPNVFDELAVSMVEVGERTGMLHEVLAHLAEHRRSSERLKGRIGTALIYPAIVTSAGVGVMIFLSTFVVPRLLETLSDAGRPLPWITRIVKLFSDLLIHYGWAIALAAIGAVVAGVLAYRRPAIRHAWHRLQLRLPLVGRLIQQQAIVRMSVTLAILSRSGMEFVHALRLVGRSMPNSVYRDSLQQAAEAISAGRDIAPSLSSTQAFPQPVVRLLEVGQASGRLDSMLDRLAADYDQQLQSSTQRLLAALEPAMILMLAGMIGFIVLAVILPYLRAGDVL